MGADVIEDGKNAVTVMDEPTVQPSTLLATIMQVATRSDVNVENIERLLALHERVEAKAAERAFNTAMNAAQEEIRPIATDKKNGATNSDYATFLALDSKLRPIYTAHGFSLSFDTGPADSDQVLVLCYVAHAGGHSRTYRVLMPADGKGAKGNDVMTKTHAAGAAMTYGQRYLLKLIFNVPVGKDDDGNGAGGEACISDAQVETLFSLLEKSKTTSDDFCAYFKVDAVIDLKRKDFARAKTKLELTISRAGQA